MKKNLSLKNNLLIVILTLAIIPVVILGITSTAMFNKNTNEDFQSNGASLINIAQNMIEEKISAYENSLDTIISKSDFTNIQKLRQDMSLLKTNDTSILNIYYADQASGGMIQVLDDKLPDGYDPRVKSWYKESVAGGGNFTIHSPYKDILTGKYAITIYKPVMKNNSAIGVICIDIDLSQLSNRLSSIRYGKTGELIITDKTGLVVSNSDRNKIGGQEPTKYATWKDISAGNSGTLKFNYGGTKYEGSFSTSDKTGWKVILKINSSELRQNEVQEMIITIVLIIALTIVALLISIKFSKSIGISINKLKDGLEKAAMGEFDSDINIKSNIKEFIVLGQSFTKMKNNVSKLMLHVDGSVIKVNDNAENSARTSEDISSVMGQVSKTITEISSGTMQSANSLEYISGDMHSLSNSMDNIKLGVENVNNMAKKTNDLGSKGLEVVHTVMNKSNATKNNTEEVRKVVDEVSESIVKIEGINQTISSITEQTNLLALNAAIEAARAGEAGRGFAVVSDQIRKLAEETAESAKQIDEIIKEINEKAKLAVSKVHSTTECVNLQEEAVVESQEIFTEIVSAVGTLSTKVYEIAEGVESINSMKDNVVNQVENLSSLLEETAAGTEEVTASVEEVAASTDEFMSNFGELRDTANTLKEQVSQFKF